MPCWHNEETQTLCRHVEAGPNKSNSMMGHLVVRANDDKTLQKTHQVQEISLAEVGAAEAPQCRAGGFAFRVLGHMQCLGARIIAQQVPAGVRQPRQLCCGPCVLLPQVPGMKHSQALRSSQSAFLLEKDSRPTPNLTAGWKGRQEHGRMYD